MNYRFFKKTKKNMIHSLYVKMPNFKVNEAFRGFLLEKKKKMNWAFYIITFSIAIAT